MARLDEPPCRWVIRTPTSTSQRGGGEPPDRASTTPARGTSTAGSTRPWTRCAARRRCDRRQPLRGERRRVAVQAALKQPDLLLLDEPTNHLDAERAVARGAPEELPGAIPAVTHDRYFLDNVAEWILELDRGRPTPMGATTPPTWRPRRSASKIEAAEGREAAKMLTEELDWSAGTPRPARPKKFRLQRYEEMAAEADRCASSTPPRSIPAGRPR